MSDGARFDQIRKEVSDCVDVDNESRFTAQRVEDHIARGIADSARKAIVEPA